jgi:ParB family chromosome partitioning protein
MTALPVSEWRDSIRLDTALLDPRKLAPHPRNVRQHLGDLEGLTASIAAQGVIEPLTVIALDDRSYQIVAGHRRAAAAIAAGVELVPCVIRLDLSVDAATDHVQAEHVGAMLAENLQRAELTAVEEARGIQTMLDLDVDVNTVVARTGLDRKRVMKAAGVARMTPSAAAAVAGAGLTLDQAAVVARFEDNTAAVDQLVQAAGEGPGRFAHAVTRAEQDRALAEAIASKRAEMVAAGRTVLEESSPAHQVAARISDLLHAGQVIDPDGHRSCRGSAVAIRGQDYGTRVDVLVYEVCTAPAANGHTQRWGRDPRGGPGASMSDEELERQRAERRQVLDNNKALAAANATRRAWIREYLQRAKAPKEALRFAVEEIATNPHALHCWTGSASPVGDHDADAAMGLQTPVLPWSATPTEKRTTLTTGERVPDARLPLQLLAHIAGAIETRIAKDSWRGTADEVVRWLRFLVDQGYELSDIEQTMLAPADGAQ